MFYAAIIVIFTFLIIASTKSFHSRDSKLPGPAFAILTKLMRVWYLVKGDGPETYLKLHAQYGAIVKTGPNHVSLADPSSILVIYDAKGRFKKVTRTPVA